MKKGLIFAMIGLAIAGLTGLAIWLIPSHMPLPPAKLAVSSEAEPRVADATPMPTATPEPTPAPTATPVASATAAPVSPIAATPVPDLPLALTPEVDDSQADQAVVSIRISSDKKIKVQIGRSGAKYTHDLRGNNLPTRYPLHLGPGDYAVDILENVSGTSYRRLDKVTVSGTWSDDTIPYLQSTQRIRWDATMSPIVDALKLAADRGDAAAVTAIYEELATTLVYDFDVLGKLPAGYLPDIETTYATRKGICYDMSSLMASMLRATGTPAKLMLGYSELIDGRHAWNEILVDGQWIVVDLTVISIMREEGKDYSFASDAKKYTPEVGF